MQQAFGSALKIVKLSEKHMFNTVEYHLENFFLF